MKKTEKKILNGEYLRDSIVEVLERLKSNKMTGQQGNAAKSIIFSTLEESRKALKQNHELGGGAQVLLDVTPQEKQIGAGK